nr:MAG TPA: hypothetical protein [Caudoviricetes sp.]
MSGKKKSRSKNGSLEKIVLTTALIQLIQALINLINKLLE